MVHLVEEQKKKQTLPPVIVGMLEVEDDSAKVQKKQKVQSHKRDSISTMFRIIMIIVT